MIARTWRGRVRTADAEPYADYVRATGFGAYADTPGNRGAWLLRRDDGPYTELVAFSLWDSLDAVAVFAGPDVEAAVLYPEDERYLVEPSTVTHHHVVDRGTPR